MSLLCSRNATVLAILSCLFLLSSQAVAQFIDIRGVVTDSLTGERLPNATVVVKGTNKGAATNLNGFYLIPHVPFGRHEIVASYLGYHSRTKFISTRDGDEAVLDFQLAASPIESPEIVVTGKRERELSEISPSFHILDQADIKAVPVTVQQDLFRALTILPGIVSTSDVSSQFYVRGGAGDQNLILLDGMKIHNPYHAMGIFSIFDTDLIKTTEIYLGGFPASYGGRLSSVVNVFTKDGRTDKLGAKANVNFLSSKAMLEGSGKVIFDMTWVASMRHSISARPLKTFFRQDTPLDFYDGFFKATFGGSEEGKLSFHGFLSGDNLRSSKATDPDYTWRNGVVGMSGSGLLAKRLYVDFILYQSTFEAERVPKQSALNPTSTTNNEAGLRVNMTKYNEEGSFFSFGLDATFPRLDYNLVNRFGASLDYHSFFPEMYSWLRYQGDFEGGRVDVGLHIDVASPFQRFVGIEVVQPRVSFSKAFSEQWRWKLSYGKYTQNYITVNNEDDLISIFDAWVNIPKEMAVEQSDHYIAGMAGNIVPWLSSDLQAYYKRFGSLIVYNRNKIDSRDPDYINGNGDSYGAEILVRSSVNELDVMASYGIAWAQVMNAGVMYFPRYDRRHSVKALINWRAFKNFEIGLRWDFGSGFPFTGTAAFYDRLTFDNIFRDAPTDGETGKPYQLLGPKNSLRLPIYQRVDASASYKFDVASIKGSLGLNAINLFNQKNVFYFDRATGQQIDMLPLFVTFMLELEY